MSHAPYGTRVLVPIMAIPSHSSPRGHLQLRKPKWATCVVRTLAGQAELKAKRVSPERRPPTRVARAVTNTS
eukprot:12894131-Prorocentrum_lima.AAC.1